MRQQGGSGGIKGPQTVEEGQPIPVDIQVDGATEVIVVTGGNSNERAKSFPIGPDRKVNIPPQPSWRAGTLVYITVATPPYVTIVVEIVPQGE